jgi:cytolysin-activating lysine-acyltransferase
MDASATLTKTQSPAPSSAKQAFRRPVELRPVNLPRITANLKPPPLEAVVNLSRHSLLHQQYSLRDFNERILASLNLNQHRLYFIGAKPIGFVNWAWLDDETAARMASGSYNLRPHEWSCGPHLWIPELLAPYGHTRKIIRDLRNNVFAKGTLARAVRVNAKGEFSSLARYKA